MAKKHQKNPKKDMGSVNYRVPSDVKLFLLEKADRYERPDFIADDPISIPGQFSKKGDIEVAGFLTATIAWGQRKTILSNAQALMHRMDHDPLAFVLHANANEIRSASEGFVHRTFQSRDLELFLHALQELIQQHGDLERAFILDSVNSGDSADSAGGVYANLTCFHHRFFDAARVRGFEPERTQKHVANPSKGSAAKRLNMFLRWMVRSPQRGVDFGIWTAINPNELMIPLDVHTSQVGRKLGLLRRSANDWKALEELMASLRQIDAEDPVRLDFALFGLGAIEGF